jgi:hypothetical protein
MPFYGNPDQHFFREGKGEETLSPPERGTILTKINIAWIIME